MCILVYLPPGMKPDVEALRAGAAVNADGYGYAIWTGAAEDPFIVRKTLLNPEALVEQFAEERAAHPEGPALFHARWITSGPAGIGNVQPFWVQQENGPAVFAHNGTLADITPDHRSDSRILAQVLPRHMTDPHVQEMFKDYLRANSVHGVGKAVLVTAAGETLLFGEDDGVWENGIWYSNHDYVTPVPAPPDGHIRLRMLYRRLAVDQQSGDEEAGLLRAALLRAYPALTSGRNRNEH